MSVRVLIGLLVRCYTTYHNPPLFAEISRNVPTWLYAGCTLVAPAGLAERKGVAFLPPVSSRCYAGVAVVATMKRNCHKQL